MNKRSERFSVVATGVFNYAQAQRSGIRGDRVRDTRSSNIFQSRNERGSAINRTHRNANNFNNYNRAVIASRENGRVNTINSNRIISTNQQRNDVAVRERRDNYTVSQQRTYRENSNVDRIRYPSQNVVQRNVVQRNYNTYNNYNRNYNRGGYYRGGYYYPRHIFMTGPRYTVLPRSSISIYFGGFPYYYNDGFFYGQFGGYYQPLYPPIGIRIGVLPFGYRRIFIGANPFYYYNGIYYRNDPDRRDYEVVDAPMGATVSSLPKGAKSVVLNGEKLYELNGTYYKEDRNYKGEIVYTVIGKNGEINNSNTADENAITPPSSLNPGDVINQLPEGSKVVTINGEKLYVTPYDTYLKEETDGEIVNTRWLANKKY